MSLRWEGILSSPYACPVDLDQDQDGRVVHQPKSKAFIAIENWSPWHQTSKRLQAMRRGKSYFRILAKKDAISEMMVSLGRRNDKADMSVCCSADIRLSMAERRRIRRKKRKEKKNSSERNAEEGRDLI